MDALAKLSFATTALAAYCERLRQERGRLRRGE